MIHYLFDGVSSVVTARIFSYMEDGNVLDEYEFACYNADVLLGTDEDRLSFLDSSHNRRTVKTFYSAEDARSYWNDLISQGYRRWIPKTQSQP